MLFMALSLTGYAQNLLTGRVTDDKGEGLPGVSIIIKGTNNGVMSDTDGKFTLQDVPAEGTLVISYIGYVTQEVNIAGRTTINVSLITDIKTLDEMIVVGYGTSTAKELTGSVSVVKGSTLESLNPVRIDQALQGQAAGVQISTASGSPGGALNIRIRGLSTNGNNNPLVLVDGIPYSTDGLNALNPSDVESVNVLKDATAGIYGVRAANGVIIITTKQGRRNSAPSFEFSAYEGVQQTTKKLGLLNAREYAILKNEAFAAGGQTPPFANVNLGAGTDWQDEVFEEKAPLRNYNLNVNGGSEKVNYSIGGSYLDQKGIVGGDKASYRRYNARINLGVDFTPKVKFQNVLLFTSERRKTLPESSIASVLYNAINASPVASVTDPSRDPLIKDRYTWLEEVNDVINPVAQIAYTFNETKVNKLVGKPELSYKVNDNFEVTGRVGFDYANVNGKTFNPLVYYGSGKPQNSAMNAYLVPDSVEVGNVNIPRLNSVNESRTTYIMYNPEIFINYNQNFGDHKVKGTLGMSAMQEGVESLSGTAFGIDYNSYDFADISAAEGANPLNNTSSYQDRSRMQSIFLRGEYNFKDKYLASFLVRRDGSSRFGSNNRFGYFPTASAAWIVTEESFFNFDQIEFLKVRASFGISGNDKIGGSNFPYRALLGGEAVYPFNNQLATGTAIGLFGNADLKWETTRQTNIGVDLTFFKSKVDVTVDYYVKQTRDLIFQPAISAIVGAYGPGSSPPFVNGGDVKNSGFEFTVTYNDRIGERFNFSVGYNLTTIHNEVTALPKGVDFYEYGSFSVGGGNATRMQVGHPIGSFFGYKTDGVYQSQEEIDSRDVVQSGAHPGDLRFVDVTPDGVINFSNDSDKTFLGSAIPEVIMGINLGASFMGFDLSTTLYASIGNEILRNYERQQPLANLLDYRKDRWTGSGSTNEHPRLTTGLNETDPNKNNVLSDYFVEDGSFLRIKNVQLGYTLPANISERIGATKLRIYIAANNLATFTRYRGYSPDFNSGSPLDGGVDYGFYPQARTFMAGVNLNF